jgi:pyroglutamyl-peptidase
MILVTGFGPYKGEMNASGALVASFIDALPAELAGLAPQLALAVIACDDTSRQSEHLSLERQLKALLAEYRPEICLFTGQAPPYDKITIEKVAINSFMREIIDPSRPVGYFADVPGLATMQAALEQAGIPAAYSFYAGQHLCNHILYSSLYFAEREKSGHKSGFIHIPVLPVQTIGQYSDAPGMPLDILRKALAVIISHVAGSFAGKRLP